MQVKIGLETHVQLATKTKLFCPCSIENISQALPNTRTCEICLGFPGSKPRVNEKAIEFALKIALALNCKINREFFFSRKNYFYPDMSKNFQITQYEIPIAEEGYLMVGGKRIGIKRVHLEEDPARMVHVGKSLREAKYTLVDYNRSGIPLVEIVTYPDFSSPREAREYLKQLMLILQYLGVFDPEKQIIKSDANISIEGGERVEIKNITGFKEVEQALNFEILRQKNLLRRGRRAERETRMWDPASKTTFPLREKEEEEDYGYIFEPDLPRFVLSGEEIARIKSSMPELPQEKFEKYVKLGLSEEMAYAIAEDLQLAQFFENLLGEFSPRTLARWISVLKKILNYNDILLSETKLSEHVFKTLVRVAESGRISDRAFDLILREIIFAPEKLRELIEKYSALSGEELLSVVEHVLRENERAVKDYLGGEERALDFLVGQVMRATRGRAEPKEARRALLEKLAKLKR